MCHLSNLFIFYMTDIRENPDATEATILPVVKMNDVNTPEEKIRLLVLGGANSGKSLYGERIAKTCTSPWIYIATAASLDHEMKRKIKDHQERRSGEWTTVEEPLDLSRILEKYSKTRQTLLIDCLTLWVSNLLIGGDDFIPVLDRFCHSVRNYQGSLVMVSNEVGLGIVPDTNLGREFREMSGILNQKIADTVDSVHFIVSGLPIILKDKK